MQNGFQQPYAEHASQIASPTTPDAIASGDSSSDRTKKRKQPPLPTGNKPAKKVKKVGSKEHVAHAGDGEGAGDGAGKPKRTRTGCLTCRERHLKCDEGMPDCNNCRKSSRVCKRGLRLNFIDTWAKRPPIIMTLFGTRDWRIQFYDESRIIASEYQGGLEKYKNLDSDRTSQDVLTDPALVYEYPTVAPPPAPHTLRQPLPPIQGIMSDMYVDPSQRPDANTYDAQLAQDHSNAQPQQPPSGSTQHSGSNQSVLAPGSVGSYGQSRGDMLLNQTDFLPDHEMERKEYIDNAEDTLFMQVFVEEVGLWMDSMDPHKHFSRLLPFHSLSEPMLLNAFLACGAKHLTLVNPAYAEEKALNYYDTATRYLLKNLRNPDRDTVVCATTAVILNVYEIMSERAMQRMNHIAGARALIKECGWNARAQGIGAACFWLNVGLEVLSCLHFNWQVAWDPDDWGVDMDFSREIHNGREEVWTHRMLYIIAKVCNFRATISRYDDSNGRDQQSHTQQRYSEWSRLKDMVDAWNNGIPRTMQPMANLHPYQTTSKSQFPEIWLIKRSTIVARLFYHTALLLLAQVYPYYGTENPEMAELQTRHATMICGIAAHVKDRGVASVALRSLAHAAEVLTDRREQEEVLEIFGRINKETGWRIGFVYIELKEKWGWNEEASPQQFAQTHTAARQQKEAQQLQQQAQAAQSMHLQQQQQPPQQQTQFDLEYSQYQQQQQGSGTTSQQRKPTPMNPKKMPQGISNPLYAKADFSLPQHPYQNFYVAPSGHTNGVFANPLGSGHLYYNQ